MNRKTAIITGANSGMGKAASIALAQQGIHVVMVCRNEKRGREALAQAKAQSGSENIELMLCDLGNLADVRRFCHGATERYPHIDILINNAGVLSVKRQETQDGLELHFGVCHVGHFLLTNTLLGNMGPGSRIVMVGSVAHKAGHINFDDLAMTRRYSVAAAYARAKLCNMLYTTELARRLSGTGITVNCVHPGAVITGIGANRGRGHGENTRLRKGAGVLLRPFLKDSAQGAATAVYVATSPQCEGITGGYFANCKQAKPAKRAIDSALSAKLWAASERICGEIVGESQPAIGTEANSP